MESFYGEPRCAPVPTVFKDFESCISPRVPEVSLIVDDAFKIQQNRLKHMNYSAWKKTNAEEKSVFCNSNKENIITNIDEEIKPHIQFESNFPELKSSEKTLNFAKDCKETATSRPPLFLSNNDHFSPAATNKFEQFYMANIPNKHLDLSFADIKTSCSFADANSNKNCDPLIHDNHPSSVAGRHDSSTGCIVESSSKDISTANVLHTSVKTPINNTYKEYCTKNFSHKDTYNFKQPIENMSADFFRRKNDEFAPATFSYHNDSHNLNQLPTTVTTNTQTSIFVKDVNFSCCHDRQVKRREEDEPTVKDLLTIIQQQNQQLLNLQKQVAFLLKHKERQESIESLPSLKKIEASQSQEQCDVFPEKCVTSTQHDTGVFRRTPKKNPLSKFAIDVMTSFEVSIRPQQNFNARNKFLKDYPYEEPKIQEIISEKSSMSANEREKHEEKDCKITQADLNSDKSTDVSLVLNEPVSVPETCPTPEQSVHINMQDYSDSDDDDDDNTSSSDVGWSLYNNVMQQVNNILLKNKEKSKQMLLKEDICGDGLDRKTARQVKQTTVKHLKKIGVDLSDIHEDTDSDRSSSSNKIKCSSKEVSFAVKQLLMKYLPDEYLVTATNDTNTNDVCEKNDFRTNACELSLATKEYMKKYNLIKPKDKEKTNFSENCNVFDDNRKILDITALKQQPKLL